MNYSNELFFYRTQNSFKRKNIMPQSRLDRALRFLYLTVITLIVGSLVVPIIGSTWGYVNGATYSDFDTLKTIKMKTYSWTIVVSCLVFTTLLVNCILL